MYNINYNPNSESIRATSQIAECKSFHTILHHSPGDRHAYSLKYFASPIRYLLKDIFKTVQNAFFLKCTNFLLVWVGCQEIPKNFSSLLGTVVIIHLFFSLKSCNIFFSFLGVINCTYCNKILD